MTMITTQSPQHAHRTSLTTWVKQHALWAYFFCTIGLAWPVMIAEVLGSRGLIPFRLTLSGVSLLLTLSMAYSPTIAALLVTGMTEGWVGVRALMGRLLIWRIGWRWYAVALLLPGVIGLGAMTSQWLRSGVGAVLPPLSWQLLLLPVALLVRGIVNGEEIGWRGFALPRLQARWNALTASLIVGGLAALFHLPIFFAQGNSILGSQNLMNPLAFLIDIVAGAIVVTWLCNNTRGSLLIAYLYHGAVNTWTSEVFHLSGIDSTLLTAVVAMSVVFIFGPKRLAHKQEQIL